MPSVASLRHVAAFVRNEWPESAEYAAEIEKTQKAVEILEERQKELRPEIMSEFKEKYRKKSEKDLKEFAKKLKEVFEIEEKLVEQRKEISREAMKALDGTGRFMGYGIPSEIMVPFRPVLTDGAYKSFSQLLKEEGINID